MRSAHYNIKISNEIYYIDTGRRTDYFVKPWRMSLEESIFSPAEDTTLLSSTLSSDSLMLFPANQVINNNDSELDITLKFDRIIRKFMQNGKLRELLLL